MAFARVALGKCEVFTPNTVFVFHTLSRRTSPLAMLWTEVSFVVSLGSLVALRKWIESLKASEAALSQESGSVGCSHSPELLSRIIAIRQRRRLVNGICCAILGVCLGSGSLHVYDSMRCAAMITCLCWLGLGYASVRQHLAASQDEHMALSSTSGGPKIPKDGQCFCCPPGAIHFPPPRRRNKKHDE